MAKLFAIYQQPQDAAAFDKYYYTTHVPLAKTIPGLKSYEVTTGDVMGMAGKHGVYLVAVLEFESLEAIGAAMVSPTRPGHGCRPGQLRERRGGRDDGGDQADLAGR